MNIDTEKIDEAVLALLYLTLHEGSRAWKGLDWDAMNRLHDKGFISNPIGKAKSVMLTDKGLEESERLFRKLFVKGQS
jgi:hypothetical protein